MKDRKSLQIYTQTDTLMFLDHHQVHQPQLLHLNPILQHKLHLATNQVTHLAQNLRPNHWKLYILKKVVLKSSNPNFHLAQQNNYKFYLLSENL